MSKNNKLAKDEDDVFEFLNSLPESDKNGGSSSAAKGSKADAKTDEDILDFLDELEASDKKKGTSATASPTKKKSTESKPATEEISLDEPTKETVPETTEVEENISVNDPITSFSNWWSKEGSARVSSQMTSFWGTAQSIRQTAQEKAEEALKIAKENSLEDNLKNAFKEVGITGVLEGDRELTEEEKKELLKLPDVAKTFDNLNKGFGFFQNRLATVIDKIQHDLVVSAPRDEILNIKLVHDLKNYPVLAKYVKNNFELVMRSQVDGEIDVKITESGTASSTEDAKNLGLFTGKILDGEKLIQANIDCIIKESEKATKDKETEVQEDNNKTEKLTNARTSDIYIGILASTIQTSTSSNEEENNTITIDSYSPNSFTFTTILVDTTHDITIINRSQPFPLKWAKWLDGQKDEESEGKKKEEKSTKKQGEGEEEEEEEDVNSDDYEVDPSEWVSSWIDRGLDMTFGVLAQSYVIRRMGY